MTRPRPLPRRTPTALGALALTTLGTLALVQAAPSRSASAPDEGAALFKRCAACHTSTGKGVPGTYPPLQADFRQLAASKAGRQYIALAVMRGLMGPLTIEGKSYRSVMPAQADLDDAQVAAVLNHVGTTIAKTGPAFKPLSPAEVASARALGAKLTPAEVARLHQAAGGQ
ncbi:cytochrome c [Novosphingobium sp. 1949]|uniref:Cytochrome c n=1 Tax=Novosphingobium organovorum TaxID=2930092 RepID=A0ABT0BJ77_9SPHN|nr:cytochrome c [Novosphingobium organovorum]MCJ2185092.1 cytochrome c [Novosphingobium organovorum]